jgi:hypothetical protein
MNPKIHFYRNIPRSLALYWSVGLLLCHIPLSAFADIYKCQGESSIPAFVDDKTKRSGNYRDCVLYMRADNQPVQPRRVNQAQTGGTQAAGGQDFPKIDGQTQSRMDSKRKQILQEELSSEQKALLESKKLLQEAQTEQSQKPAGSAGAERVVRLQKEVEGHQSNIRLLEKELSSVNPQAMNAAGK